MSGVKKTVTYREITIAIGVVVAVVIALTLWTRGPGDRVSESHAGRRTAVSVTARYLYTTTMESVSALFSSDNSRNGW